MAFIDTPSADEQPLTLEPREPHRPTTDHHETWGRAMLEALADAREILAPPAYLRASAHRARP